jgi:hypothetical protein
MASSDYRIEVLNHSDSLEIWDDFVDKSPQGCIFCRSWWLKAVCPDEFEILTLRKSGRIIAGMPLPISRRFYNRIISMPMLTQTLGVLLEPPTSAKYEARLSKEMEMVTALIEAMPGFSYFSARFHYTFTNWLPFYWAGFNQTTRYTYVIEDLTNQKELHDNLSPQIRNKIRKAEAQGVSIVESDDIDILIEMNKKTFARQGLPFPFPRELIQRIDKECSLRDARRIFLAKDSSGSIHSALLVVFDKKSMYNLMQGGDPALRSSGANPLAMWRSIQFAREVTAKYDFEGSMIPNVEPFFRSFGAVQLPYFSITKDNRSWPVRVGFDFFRLANGALRRVGLRRLT